MAQLSCVPLPCWILAPDLMRFWPQKKHAGNNSSKHWYPLVQHTPMFAAVVIAEHGVLAKTHRWAGLGKALLWILMIVNASTWCQNSTHTYHSTLCQTPMCIPALRTGISSTLCHDLEHSHKRDTKKNTEVSHTCGRHRSQRQEQLKLMQNCLSSINT